MVKLDMQYSKSTKNTHVYVNGDVTAAVTSLYVNKTALKEPPQTIVVSIEAKQE